MIAEPGLEAPKFLPWCIIENALDPGPTSCPEDGGGSDWRAETTPWERPERPKEVLEPGSVYDSFSPAVY